MNNILGFGSAFVYCFLTVIMGIITKIIYKNGIDRYTCFFLCSLISTIFFSMIVYLKNRNFNDFKLDKKQFLYSIFIGGFIFIFATKFCIFSSLQYIDVSIQKPISGSHSLVTIILTSLISKTFPNKKQIASLLLVLSGLFLIMYDIDFKLQSDLISGIFYAFLSMLAIAGYALIKQYYKININEFVYSFYAFLFASILGFFAIVINNSYFFPNISNLNLTSITLLIFNGIFCFAGTFITFGNSVKKIGSNNTTLICSIGPILTIIFAKIFLNETISTLQFIGICLIILNTILTIKNNNHGK